MPKTRAPLRKAARHPERLDAAVRPRAYDLSLALDPQRSKRYHGVVRIELELAKPSASLVLHAADLKLSRADLYDAQGGCRARLVPDVEHETVTLELPRTLQAGLVTLSLAFAGTLRDDLRGLYAARSGKHRYAFSQLEAADARRFFPCFDEPSFKAHFTLHVTTAQSHAVVSNSPVARRERHADGTQTVHFEPTPLLSTYLVALAVGELTCSSITRAGETPIRLWHVPGHEQRTRFAREVARECLVRLERYFDLPYPYAKLDLVAVPDFEIGAMENAGAVFFRETLLLLDEKTASWSEQKRAAEVICHELAHMWYGNLVTMAWWDDLWLNEAFATWMAYVIVDDYRPELGMWSDFCLHGNSALELDALSNTHPIYCEVHTPADATENFDAITYEKGASVLRMLERYLGADVFRDGVRRYMKRHREGNTVASDLWNALSESAGRDVAPLVRAWIERPGFPLLRVDVADGAAAKQGKATAAKVTLSLRQERFSPTGKAAKKSAPWPVPVVLRAGASSPEPVRHLLEGPRATVELPARARGFVYANADEGSFLRPLHAPALLAALVEQLDVLAPVERLGLVNHQWALARAGYADVPSFLALALSRGAERDPDVLGALVGPLSHLDELAALAGPSCQTKLREQIIASFGPAMTAATLKPGKRERDPERVRRAQLTALLGLIAEHAPTGDGLETLAERFVRDESGLDANLALPALTLAARRGDAKRFAAFLKLSHAAPTPLVQRRFRLALAEFREPALVDQLLRETLGPRIPTQDVAFVLVRLMANRDAREACWKFSKRNWPALVARMPAMLASRFVDATPRLGSAAHERDVLAFFAKHPVPNAARAVKQARERFRLERALRSRALPQLKRWAAARQ
jgi:puromycin-sensitive aminopeptidase